MNAYEIVNTARKVNRPTTLEYIDALCENFIEFHGDRVFSDDKSIIGGIAAFNGMPITVIGIQKGKTLDENLFRNFGQVRPEGYRKALRLMRQAEKFNRPIITLINTSGAYPGLGAEERGQGEAIARNLLEMSDLKVPIIAVLCGEGGSGGALALAVADKVWILKNAIYSVLSPEGFAAILWKDGKLAAEAAEFMKLTSDELYKLDIVDKIIDEDVNGVENNFQYTIDILRVELINELKNLKEKSIEELTDERYKRFRKYGDTSTL
ncbi:MAG: acetyl-CoA carboxylase carboxyl transferase subunit alpha [Lachnospirales bacterium]